MENAKMTAMERENLRDVVNVKPGGRKKASGKVPGNDVSCRKIGLVCNGQGPSEDAVKYVISACENLGACLDILNFEPPGAESRRLNGLLAHLTGRGIPFRTITATGDKRKVMLGYAKDNSDVLFVAIDGISWKSIAPKGAGRRSELSLRDMRCPLVVVSETGDPGKVERYENDKD